MAGSCVESWSKLNPFAETKTQPSNAHHPWFWSRASFGIGKDYDDVKPLGEGGMGNIYTSSRPKHLELPFSGDRIAIKKEKKDYGYLQQEGDLANRMARRDPDLFMPTVYDAKNHLLLMPFDPKSVSLDVRLKNGPPLSEREKQKLVTSLFRALEDLENEGISHGDLKPSNILLTKGGQVKIIDFGVSTVFGDSTSMVANGGTPGYMSADRLAGAPRKASDDLHSARLILWEIESNLNLAAESEDNPHVFLREASVKTPDGSWRTSISVTVPEYAPDFAPTANKARAIALWTPLEAVKDRNAYRDLVLRAQNVRGDAELGAFVRYYGSNVIAKMQAKLATETILSSDTQ